MVAPMLSGLSFRIMFFLFTAVSAARDGFTVDLFRNRPSKLLSQYGSPYSDTFAEYDEYIMKISIGTPPLEVTGIVDTGSDNIWTQCEPCESCYKQDSAIFDPSKSSTYRDVDCGKGSTCPHESHYADKGYFIGNLGVETVTLPSDTGEPFVLRDAVFGCGHRNSERPPSIAGIIGLGWGPNSLVSQMGDSIEGLFSYCFGNGTGKINFGANAVVSGDGVSSTNLYSKDVRPHFYYLNLEAISVDGDRIETTGTSIQATDGNMIIDTGAAWTYLPRDYYLRLKEALTEAVRVEPAAPPGAYYEGALCYRSANLEDFPVITMHFTDVDLVLNRTNTYDMIDGVICFTFISLDGINMPATFGNKAHSNMLVGYDTRAQIISFKSTDCNALWH